MINCFAETGNVSSDFWTCLRSISGVVPKIHNSIQDLDKDGKFNSQGENYGNFKYCNFTIWPCVISHFHNITFGLNLFVFKWCCKLTQRNFHQHVWKLESDHVLKWSFEIFQVAIQAFKLFQQFEAARGNRSTSSSYVCLRDAPLIIIVSIF